MLWTNECDRVRRQLALHAGGDLTEADLAATEWASVQQHLRCCLDCRTAEQALAYGQRVLTEARASSPRETGSSLWAQVSTRMRAEPVPQARLSGWLPAAAMAAACAAVMLVAFLNPAFDDSRFLDSGRVNGTARRGLEDASGGEGLHTVSEREGGLMLSPQMRRLRSALYSDSNSY